MRICHISTFPPAHCGIAYYTKALVDGLHAQGATKQYILTEPPAKTTHSDNFDCIPCWERNGDYVTSIITEIKKIKPDIALLQYTNDIFGDDNRFPILLGKLRKLGVTTIVNPHSVYPPNWKTRFKPGRDSASFDKAMSEAASCIMVHSPRMREDLANRKIDPYKIVVIPHGSLIREPRPRDESRKIIKVPNDAKVVLFFGFIWLGKGVEFLMDVFGRVARQVPEAWLYIGGYTRKRVFYTRAYVGSLYARAALRGFSKRLSMWGDFVPDDITPYVYSASDLVAMPYKQDYSSVSGVVHQAAGFSTPMFCSRISKFDEVRQSISEQLMADYGDKDAWVDGITRLLSDDEHYMQMKKAVDDFAQSTSWENVARTHLALYEKLLNGKDTLGTPQHG